MDGSPNLVGSDALPEPSKGSQELPSVCIAPLDAAEPTAGHDRRSSSPALAALAGHSISFCEIMGERQQRYTRRCSVEATSQRGHGANAEADPGCEVPPMPLLFSLVSPSSVSCQSFRREDAPPVSPAACNDPPTAASRVPSMVCSRRRVRGPKSPLLLQPSGNNTSNNNSNNSSNNTSSHSNSSSSNSNSNGEESGDLSTALARELTCPICLEIFRLPVTVVCGHSFCRYCIGHKKLTRKACPLCRQDIGKFFAVNTVLCNMLAYVTSDRQQMQQRRRHGSPASYFLSVHACNPIDGAWWAQHCVKPKVAAPLAIRLLLPEVAEESGLLLDDLVACVLDAFDRKTLWAEQRWCFNLQDAETFCRMVGFDRDDQDATRDRLHRWVEAYMSALPSICSRRGTGGGETSGLRFVVRVLGDRVHRIQSQAFDSHAVQQSLPWDMGRHQQSLLHVPHSSVSLSHLLFLREKHDGCLRIVDLGSTIGTMVKVAGVRALQSGDVIHIGDRVEVSVELFRAGSAESRRRKGTDRGDETPERERKAQERVDDCPYVLSQWDAALGKVVGCVLLPEKQSLHQPCGEAVETAGAACEAAGSGSWGVCAPPQEAEQRPDRICHPTDSSCNAAGPHAVAFVGEPDAAEGSRAAGACTQHCSSSSSSSQRGLSDTDFQDDSQRTTAGESLEETTSETLEPVESFLLLKIHESGRSQPREVWVDPRGVLLGRGPQNSRSDLKKLSVTASNGYVSRQHCVIYYDGQQPAESRWMLKDLSTLGTFIRLKPLEPYPCSISPPSVFKVGQCNVEVAPWTQQQQQSQSAPVDAPLQRLVQPQRSSYPQLTALPTREHLRDLARELERQREAQTPTAGLLTAEEGPQQILRTENQLPRLHTSFPVFLPWNRSGVSTAHQAQRQMTPALVHWRLRASELEPLYHPPSSDELPASGQPLPAREEAEEMELRRGDSEALSSRWLHAQPHQSQPADHSDILQETYRTEAVLAEMPLSYSQFSLPNLPEAALSSPVHLDNRSDGAPRCFRQQGGRGRGSMRGSTRGNAFHRNSEMTSSRDQSMSRPASWQGPQRQTEIPRGGFVLASSADEVEMNCIATQQPRHRRTRERGAFSALMRELPAMGNTLAMAYEPLTHEILLNSQNRQAGSLRLMNCAASERLQGRLEGDGRVRPCSPSYPLASPFPCVGPTIVPGNTSAFVCIGSGGPVVSERFLGQQEPSEAPMQRPSWDASRERNGVSYRRNPLRTELSYAVSQVSAQDGHEDEVCIETSTQLLAHMQNTNLQERPEEDRQRSSSHATS